MSRSKEIFLDLVHMSSMAMSCGRTMPSELMLDRYSYERYLERKKQFQAKALVKRMEVQRLFKIREKGDKVIIELSNKGRLSALKESIINTHDELSSDMVCLVSFDIPEYVKQSREVLRNFLKRVGFSQVHKSVWQSRKNVIENLRALIDEMEVEKWVKVYQASES